MKLLIVRHGQTESNVEHIWQGQTDGVLTALGELQAIKTGEYLKDKKINFVYSSPLGRAKKTCELICNELNLGFKENVLLMEVYLGSLEGSKVVVDWDNPPKDVELFPDLMKRAKSFLEFILKNHSSEDNVLIVSHGGLIQALLSVIMKHDDFPGYYLANCSISIFNYNEGAFQEVCVGFVDHLKKLE